MSGYDANRELQGRMRELLEVASISTDAPTMAQILAAGLLFIGLAVEEHAMEVSHAR